MVVTFGSFSPGHVNDECYEELARITKPGASASFNVIFTRMDKITHSLTGGLIGILMFEGYLHENLTHFQNIEPHMKQLEEAGVWTIKERETFPDYISGCTGLQFVLQMREGKNDVIEKIQAQ